MKKRMISLLSVLSAIVLVCGGYIIWKNTANQFTAAAEAEYESFEDIEKKLIPVNMSCEDQGIRVTVVGALITEKYLWIEYDVQDLAGRGMDNHYIYENADDLFACNMELRDMGSAANSFAAEPEHIFMIRKYRYNMTAGEDTLSISMNRFPVTGKINVPVLPLLEKYGETYEGIPVPDTNRVSTHYKDIASEDLKVLDSSLLTEQLFSDDPETKNIRLGGIGWIDNLLHIQIHNADKNLKIKSSTASMYFGPFQCRHDYSGSGDPEVAAVAWDEDGDNNMDRMEYIFDCKQEDLDELNFSLNMTYIREILEGNWQFNIPLDQIRASAEVAGGIDAIKDPYDETDMVHFDIYNSTGEAVTEFKLDDSTSRFKEGWEGEGSIGIGINGDLYDHDSIAFSYKTESGYEYEITLPFDKNKKETIITMLSQEEGGGISVTYPEPVPAEEGVTTGNGQ